MPLQMLMRVRSPWPRKGNSLHKNTSDDVQIFANGPPVLYIAHPFTQPLKVLCFTILFNWPDTPKSTLSMGSSTFHVLCFLKTHPAQNPKLHLERFSHFCAAYGRKSLYFTMCVKTWL